MGAKQSKGGKVKQNGTETAGDEGLDTFDKTSTLPATFKAKDDEMTKCETLPREGVALDRNTSFSKRFRKSVSKLVGHKGKQEGCTDSPKTEDNLENKDENNADLNKTKDEKDSTVKSPIDPKLAQKIARAKFFQDLYSTPTNVPKPPRSRNGFSPQENGVSEDDVDRTNNTTPVVKLIEKHQEAIEKHQEEIRSSMGSPDILKGRMDSFRKSKLVESNEAYAVEKESTSMIEETKQEVRQEETSFKKVEENKSEAVSEQKHSVTEVASLVTEQTQVSQSQASVVIKEESTSVLKQEESHAMEEEITIKSESNLVQESATLMETVSEEKKQETFESKQVTEEFSSVQVSGQEEESTLMETVSEEKKEETFESMQVTEEFSSVQVSGQEESEFHIEEKSTSEIISQSSENKESVGEILDLPSGEKKSGDNDITDDSDAEHAGSEKEE